MKTTQRLSGVCVFILFLILCLSHEVVYVECRHLKSSRCKKCTKFINPPAVNLGGKKADPGDVGLAGNRQEFKTSKAEQPQDFRPTSPGHSPGVGHHINN
ncbi:hypothetical protein SDJN03_11597, partial [Cucurbita argyrosperma subsp. sororia]